MILICKRTAAVLASLLILCGILAFEGENILAQDSEGAGTLDRAQAVAVDGEDHVVVTGYSYSPQSDYDFLTVKYDADGRLLWTARYDGPAGSSDYASALSVDMEGNIYTVGHSNGSGTSLDLTVIKYNKDGRELWTYRYDGPSSRDDYAQAVAVDARGQIFVTGYSFGAGTEHDFVTVKLNAGGNLLWADRHNPPRNRDDSACDLALHPESGIVIAGTDRVQGTSYDILTIHYDENGNRLSETRYFTPGDEYDTARALAVGRDGSIFVTGTSYRREEGFDMVTLRYDPSGGTVWKAEYGGPAGRIDASVDIAADQTGQVYVAGKSIGADSAFDICLLKYDQEGRQVWLKRYNGPGNGADVPVALEIDAQADIIVTGYSKGSGSGRDLLTVKYDSEGTLLWEQRWNGRANGEDRPVSMALDAGGNVIVAGYSIGGDGTFDFLTLKYSSEGQIIWVSRWPERKQPE